MQSGFLAGFMNHQLYQRFSLAKSTCYTFLKPCLFADHTPHNASQSTRKKNISNPFCPWKKHIGTKTADNCGEVRKNLYFLPKTPGPYEHL